MLVVRGAVKDYDWGVVDGLVQWSGEATGQQSCGSGFTRVVRRRSSTTQDGPWAGTLPITSISRPSRCW
jgi:hypothetical protein